MTTQEKFSKYNLKVYIHIPHGKLAGTFLFWDTFIESWIFLWILQSVYAFHKLLLVKAKQRQNYLCILAYIASYNVIFRILHSKS